MGGSEGIFPQFFLHPSLRECRESLEKEKIKSKMLEQNLARSKKRFDFEYKILTDENRKLAEIRNTSQGAAENSRYYRELISGPECDVSVSRLPGLETFAIFLIVSVSVSENLVSEKSYKEKVGKSG